MFSFGKIKNKLSATRFEFSFFVHNLQPWPAGNRAIAIGYQRGKRRRGATRSVYPSTAPGKVGNVVRFNEKFEIPSTLYKAATGKSEKNTEFGPFKKKCLILAILETDGQTQATAALGRVVIDLAEFAAVESQETRTFQVACNKAIHAAVGDPLLMVTIRCRWKKAAAGPAGPGMPMDDTQSMSTDTTGSRMTANLSSFLRFRFKGGPQVNEEQDLGGFDKPKDSTATNYMDTIQESHDDEPEAAEPQKLTPTNSRLNNAPSTTTSAIGATTAAVVAQRGAAGAGAVAMASKQGQGVEVYAAGHGDKDSEPGGEEDVAGGIKPLRPATSNFVPSPLSQTAAPRSMNGTSPPPSYAREVFPRGDLVASSSSRSRAASDRLDAVDIVPGVRQELLTVAAAEVAVYLPQAAATRGPPTERMVHAPARRLARTMVSLGSGEGQVFGAAALRLIERHVLAPSADMTTLAFWWSNLVHLRAMLQGLGLANTLTGGASAHWAADTFVLTLQRLERAAFDEIVSQAWDKLLAPVLPGAKSSVKPAAATKRATQEAAIKKWFEGLDAVNDCLTRLGSSGHLDVLKQQVLLQCLKKLDTLMFYHLLAGDQPLEGLMKEYDPNNTLWGGPGRSIPPLDDSSLPFARGVLTFGGGMSVKMTVTRLQQWAAGESALTELLSRAVDGGSNSLFPLLRAAADLLMMPKELLMDRAIRLDVCSALSMGSVLHILEQFQPDEFAHDTINPAILQSLQEEAVKPFTMRNPAADISGTYRSPSDHSVLQKMEAGTEPGLEYDFESEAELDQVREMWACAGAGTSAARYKLLHDLWASNVPRKRATAPA